MYKIFIMLRGETVRVRFKEGLDRPGIAREGVKGL